METQRAWSVTIAGLIIAVGIAAAGWFIGNGFAQARRTERFVTVRGLVTRAVRADIAVWDISYTATNDDVTRANAEIDRDAKIVIAFAKTHGFGEKDLQVLATRVTDQSQFGGNQAHATGRYLVKGGIEIRSKDVDRVQRTSQLTGELIQQGVVLNLDSDNGAANPAYYFTQLDAIRPSMLAEATRSARAVAQQFALDSASRLGPIRRANQGAFEILPRDSSGSQDAFLEPRSINKTIRLVSTIDYYLED
jgi:hypothetical protein